jgi:hypothetical protein
MGAQNQTVVDLVGVGGTSPYTFSVVQDSQTTISASLSGGTLTVDASSVSPGTYYVHLRVTDQAGNSTDVIVPVRVVSTNTFTVLNENVAVRPTSFPQNVSITLRSIGGVGSVAWSLIDDVTTLTGATISGNTLSFSATTFGSWTIGLRATDSVGATATRLIELQILTGSNVSLVDGQVELDFTPSTQIIGTHTFTLRVTDSVGSTAATKTFNYSVSSPVSSLFVEEASVEHLWGTSDSTSVVYPIAGDLSGFTIGFEGTITTDNGLTVEVDAANSALVVTGPPTSFENTEVEVTIPVMRNGTAVATISREFTLISHGGTSDIGTFLCNTRPYITGEVIGLNPLRPYFNSPSFNRNQSYTVRLKDGEALPAGLSLDSVTGQIYGTVLGNDVPRSILEYVDTGSNVQGTVTIRWDICVSQFTMIDGLTDGQVQVPYSANVTTTNSAKLTTVAIHRGRLPQGLSYTVAADGLSVVLSGTPSESGYFDAWIRITDSNGIVAYFYKRIVVSYITPLVIATDQLDAILTNQAYSRTLSAFGGQPTYTWGIIAGTLPAGITLDPNSGVISGTTSLSAFSNNVTFSVTDTRGVTATAIINVKIDNALIISTAAIPTVTPGSNYLFRFSARGGNPSSYTWALASGSPALPGGFTLASDGTLRGATSLEAYNQNVTVSVTDGNGTTVSKAFNLIIAATSGLVIEIDGIAPIVRGKSYLGYLTLSGSGVSPYKWSVTADSPNALPSGLSLTADTSNGGATATLSGTTQTTLLNYAVKIQVVDANGNTTYTTLLLNTYADLQIMSSTLPQATVSGVYSTQLSIIGYNPPYTWTLVSGILPDGLTLANTGVISGVPTTQGNYSFTVRATDTLGDYTQKTLSLKSAFSTLAITTTGLNDITSGIGYSQTISATGGVAPYSWSVSPNSPNQLPQGISLTPNTGVLSGTSLQSGYSQNILFRVTDAIGVIREASLHLNVKTNIKLYTGPDFQTGSTAKSLGVAYTVAADVSSIDPRPSLTFYVMALNVLSTQPSNVQLYVPGGYTATTLSITNGTAYIKITGSFTGADAVDVQFPVTINDSGVSVSDTFTFRIQQQKNIRVTGASQDLPVMYLG